MYTDEVDLRRRLVPIALLLIAACSVDTSVRLPDGAADGGPDTSTDTAPPDAGPPDTAVMDTGVRDATGMDSAPPDTGGADGDAGLPDAFVDADTGAPDGDAGADTGAPDGDAGADTGVTCTTSPPPADVAVALPAPPSISVDGDLTEWSFAQFVTIDPTRWRDRAGPSISDPDDLSARGAWLWTATDLYFAAEVTDDTHFNESTGELIWEGDSIQVAFDMAHDGGTPYDDTDDFEYGWALTSTGTERWRWAEPTGAPPPTDTVVIVRSGNTTIYEARMSTGDLQVSSFDAGDRYGFEWLVNEMDAAGSSQGFIEWTSGIGYAKDPSLFGDLVLRECD